MGQLRRDMAAPSMAMAPLLSEGGSRVLTAVRAASRADCWAGGGGGRLSLMLT